MNGSNQRLDLSGVEETAFLTLYAKAIESQSKDPILKDPITVAMVERLDPILQEQESPMAKKLVSRSLDPRITIHIPLRAKKYDEYATQFMKNFPECVIINIGCGLDTRFFRIDNGEIVFFDLDLPDMINLKKQLVIENERYHMIGQSVLDFGWMDQIAKLNRATMILAEGVLMYLPKEQVKDLVFQLQKRFPNSELVCELTNKTWVEGFWGKLAGLKMKQRFKMKEEAGFMFGVCSADELETWGERIEFVEKWFYMDDNHPKLGLMRIFRNWKIFNEVQFTAHYRLNAGKKSTETVNN